MSTKYDEAVTALYRTQLDKFVAERKRLASELKAGGDKTGATRLGGLARPPISAWAVNQLYWEERETFDELLAAGQRLRAGDLAATSAHRDAMNELRARAEALLEGAGHATNEATLRRITTDLSALAAAGGFEPDPPGALAGDRDPPGFDMMGMATLDAPPRDVVSPPKAAKRDTAAKKSAKRDEAGDAAREVEVERKESEAARKKAEAQRREAEARAHEERQRLERERRKAEEERAKKRAEQQRIGAALHRAKAELAVQTKRLERLRKEVIAAEKEEADTQTTIAELERNLELLD